tara:strand:- start:631 stop:2244 length:1614 start_codon:yes stop_codon:yes gene_type:complete
MNMADGTLSPDGKYMWTGSEWIPAPPNNSSEQEETSATTLNMQDSVMSGDIVHNTVVNNDAAAVTSAVIEALKQLGVLDQKDSPPAPELPVEEVVLPPSFQVGDHVEYYSPTNNRWLDRCTVVGINPDGTYRVDVPKDTIVETKLAVVIGATPGSIRPAKPPLEPGDRVLVNWKNYGTYYPGTISKEYDNHTFLILFDDGDTEDRVEWSRIEIADVDSENVRDFLNQQSSELEDLIKAFETFDERGTGTIPAQKYFEILTQMGDSPLSEREVMEEFDSLGINMDTEIDYYALAKSMMGLEEGGSVKPEVVIRDAELQGDQLIGHAYSHPKLGEGPIRSSNVISVNYDERATAYVETRNTIYVVGPTGWKTLPDGHPFNDESKQFYTVQGAGIAKCNGVYIPATEFDGVSSYINGDVLLLRWRMGNGDQWWYLADRNSLDTKRGDYYRVRSSSDTPPKSGWVIDDQTEGIMPCPTIAGSSNQPAASTYSAGQQIKVEWNGSWWDAIIREVSGESYHIHYVGFDPSWDEWVDLNRIRTS